MFRSVVALCALAAAQASFTLKVLPALGCKDGFQDVQNLAANCNKVSEFFSIAISQFPGEQRYSATTYVGSKCFAFNQGADTTRFYPPVALDTCIDGSTGSPSSVAAGCVFGARSPSAPYCVRVTRAHAPPPQVRQNHG